jgi:hypothetical protein
MLKALLCALLRVRSGSAQNHSRDSGTVTGDGDMPAVGFENIPFGGREHFLTAALTFI